MLLIMRASLVLIQLLLLISIADAFSLRNWSTWKIISRHGRILPSCTIISNTDYLIHQIYNPPTPNDQQSLSKFQQPLQNHDDNVHDISEPSTGTIKMLSTAKHIVPVNFELSHAVCPIGTDTFCMIHELGIWVLASYSTNTHEANQTIQETVKLNEGKIEYRVTLSLTIDEDMDAGPFLGLVKLLKRTTEVLFVEIGERGFGTLMERGVFEDVGFEAFWTWYEFVDGDVRSCQS